LNWESKLRGSVTIPQPYERVLLRCLDQAEKRYASATELAEDVRALRRGEAPSASPHDLTDDQSRVLGVVVGACATSAQTVSLYGIEQEVGDRQTRLRTSLALRGLLSRKLIEETLEQEGYDGPFSVYKPLDAGAEWAERNLIRIEELTRVAEAPTTPSSAEFDEIPF
jgi:hypothetical protein